MNTPENAPARESLSEEYGLRGGVLHLDEATINEASIKIWRSVAQHMPQFVPEALELLTEFDMNVGARYSHGAKALFALILLGHLYEGLKKQREAKEIDQKFENIVAKAEGS